MYKRRKPGILVYGKRYNKLKVRTPKLQQGGFVTASAAYDWRDDPYEQMLLKHDAERDRALIRARGKGSGSSSDFKPSDLKKFTQLKGGLRGANVAANEAFQKRQSDYHSKIIKNPEYASSPQGIIEFNTIVADAERIESLLEQQEKQFTDAKSKIDKNDENNTFAVSTNGNVFVTDTETNKMKPVSMTEYLANIDTYRVEKLSSAMNWYENKNSSVDTAFVNEFLVNNAVSPQTVDDEYIKKNQNRLNYLVKGDMLYAPTSKDEKADDPLSSFDRWKTFLDESVSGMKYGDSQLTKTGENPAMVQKLRAAAHTIYESVAGGYSDRSRLNASLVSEVLGNNRHKANIAKLETGKEKKDYLDEQVKMLLVSKLFPTGKVDSEGNPSSPSSDSKPSFKAKTNSTFGTYQAMWDGTESTQYDYEADFVDADGIRTRKKVSGIRLPMITNAINSVDMGVKKDEKSVENTLYGNTTLSKEADVSQIFTLTGEPVSGLLGGKNNAKTFFSNDAVIEYDKNVPMIMMVMKDKKPVPVEMTAISALKIKSRQDFINAHNNLAKIDPTVQPIVGVKADNLFPGATDEEDKAAYEKYINWVDQAASYEDYEERYRDNRTPEAKAKLDYVKSSADSVGRLMTNMQNMGPMYIEPMLVVSFIFDDDRFGFKDLYEENAKQKGGFAENAIKELDAGDKEYLSETNEIDNDIWSNRYKTNFLIKAKDLKRIFAEQGVNMEEFEQIKLVDQAYSNAMSAKSALAMPTVANTVDFIKS